MTYKEIQELIKLVNKLELTEFKLEQNETKISIRTKGYSKAVKAVSEQVSPIMVSAPAPVAQVKQEPAAPSISESIPPVKNQEAADENAGLLEIKSPMVGTFYRSSAPDKPSFVKVGDSVDVGSPVCIVEAMKLFNEIESEVSGKIVKVLLEDATPVEYDQVLFLVDPKG